MMNPLRTRWAGWAVAGMLALGVGLAACSGGAAPTSGQAQEQQASNDSLSIAEQTLPAPVFPRSEARYAFIQDQAAQALGTQTTSFIWNQGQPPVPLCPSIGFPIPNTAQLTNPDKPVTLTVPYQGGAALTIGNIDPNQLYTPAASSGTFVLCVNRQGQTYTVYAEPNVVAVAGSATVVNGQIVEQGAPHMPTCTVQDAGTKKAVTTCTK